MYERVRPVRLAGFIGLIGLAAAAHFGGEHQVLLATVAFFPLLFLLALAMPERARRAADGAMSLTLLGHRLDRPRDRARDPAARAAARRRDRHRRPRRHVHRRHRRLPRRPRVRHAPARAADLAEQDASRGWSFGMSARCSPSGAPASTRTGSAAGTRCCSASPSALAAPLGDLFESKVKRDAGTKDAGTLFGAARRRARPPRRGVLHARRRVLRLAGAAVSSTRRDTCEPGPTTATGRAQARPADDRAAQRAARRAARRADPVRLPAHGPVLQALRAADRRSSATSTTSR